MARRYYSSTAQRTTTTVGITGTSATVDVASVTGLPPVPFTGLIDPDSALEEVVTVTAVASLTLTILRGQDGTSALAHDAGVTFQHGFSARDFDEPNAHINTAALHVPSQAGNSGSVLKTDGSTAAWTPLTVVVLDDLAFTGADSTYSTTLAGSAYVIDNPFRALVSVNGLLLKPSAKETGYVFQSPLDSFTGYRITDEGKIKFAALYSAGSVLDARVMPDSSTFTLQAQNPFSASDILIGA